MNHYKKIWPEFYEAAWTRNKPFEVRTEAADEPPFAPGDTLTLQEWDPKTEAYTGREFTDTIRYILRDSRFLPGGIVVLGLSGWRPMYLMQDHPLAPGGLPPEDMLVDIWKIGPYPGRICNVKLVWEDCDCEGNCGNPDCNGHLCPVFQNDMGDDVLEGDDASHWMPAPAGPEVKP